MLKVIYKTKNTEYKVHYHPHHEVFYIKSGKCEMKINGTSYVASAGDLVLLCNLENHSTRILSEPFERYILTIDPVFLQENVKDIRLIAMFKHRSPSFSHVLEMKGAEFYFEKMLFEQENKDGFSNEIMICLLKELLVSVFRSHAECFSQAPDLKTELALKIEAYIDENFKSPISIEELAKKFYLDKYYFSHSFKKITGLSPKQYLTNVRLHHAVNLITHTSFTVSKICSESGFSDLNNFIRLFKATFGKTPTQYRQESAKI